VTACLCIAESLDERGAEVRQYSEAQRGPWSPLRSRCLQVELSIEVQLNESGSEQLLELLTAHNPTIDG
jgi:hypothetical protein